MPRPDPRAPSPEDAYLERKQRRQRREYLEAVRAVLATEQGRLVLSHILQSTGVYRSVWSAHADAMHWVPYLAGRQDLGHELQLEWLEASEEFYDRMEHENRARVRREQAEDTAFEHEHGKERTTP